MLLAHQGLTANNGTIVINGAKAARRSEKKLTTFDFGAPIDGVSSCVSAFYRHTQLLTHWNFFLATRTALMMRLR